ncbi:MAG TPA: phosphodiesterase [Xanthobacteraceae bacterium]
MSAPPLLIAQISDLHIKPPGELAYRRVDTAAALTRCVSQLNRLQPRPHLVVISGDLVDTALKESYDHLNRLLAPLKVAFAAIPGNHDDRTLMRAALSDHQFASATGPLNSARSMGDIDIVLIDSVVPSAPHGELDRDTLAWLDAALAASSSRPALLFLHHPPFPTGIGHMDVQNLRNAADLAAVLRRHQRARLVASGHVHRAAATVFAGACATICPAPNHTVALDLDGRAPPSFMIEPPAFHLHAWFPGNRFGHVATHFVPIGDFDGPYPFFASDGRYL